MALLEEWIVDGAIDGTLTQRVEGALGLVLPGDIERSVTLVDGALHIHVTVPHASLEQLVPVLDAPLAHFDGAWDWRGDIDELEDCADYDLWIEIESKVPETVRTHDERELSVLSVYSKDADNEAGWSAAFVLAARLAHELGAMAAEDVPTEPPS